MATIETEKEKLDATRYEVRLRFRDRRTALDVTAVDLAHARDLAAAAAAAWVRSDPGWFAPRAEEHEGWFDAGRPLVQWGLYPAGDPTWLHRIDGDTQPVDVDNMAGD